MSQEFYEKFDNFCKKGSEIADDEDEYYVDMEDDQLYKMYLDILPELDKYNENLDITSYL